MLPEIYKLTERTRTQLAKLHLHNEWDLLLHLPLRYEDETRITPIAQANIGDTHQVMGEVVHCDMTFKPRKQLIARIKDDTGYLNLRFIHFYPNLQRQLAVGATVRVLGEVKHGYFGVEMIHPKIQPSSQRELANSLTPIYPTTQGLSQNTLRRVIGLALKRMDKQDTLPESLLHSLNLPSMSDCLALLHNPPPNVASETLANGTLPAWQRLKFDELLAQQLSMRLAKQKRLYAKAPALLSPDVLSAKLLASLPFQLTAAQTRVLAEIRADLAKTYPMHRLLQGDVGSGKTIVAALAALIALESSDDIQVAIMAPTEILAEQHYIKFKQWLEPLGISVAWLSGSLKKRDKDQAKAALADGRIRLAVGTHALFQNDVLFHHLGLVIVDEQHRFGVAQRLALKNKGQDVHQLMMSATPIPRTLAMSFFADLEVSSIDELPPNRMPIQTKLVNQTRRQEVEGFVLAICQKGQQAYWVCPLIEESDVLQLQAATDTLAQLKAALPQLNIGLVHGRMKPTEKANIMAQFVAGELNVLVATTVIEVGVDVPNASLMVIEHAERMGLAQLHQLRGRVGRGNAASTCILLFAEPLGQISKQRLKVIYQSNDGFEIARQDLAIRGPGEFLGAKQSGLPMLRFADVEQDLDLLEHARQIATQLIEKHPNIVSAHLDRWLGSREGFMAA